MSLGLVGKKIGMTHVYTKDGSLIPVTVVHVGGNQVLQVKNTTGKDGYAAAQVGYDTVTEKRVSKPVLGHIKKNGGAPKRKIVEFRFASDEGLPTAGSELNADVFAVDQIVDVIGVTKGRGFQGVVKRWNFSGQPSTHGHMMHRRPGSIGCRLTPGLVWKNQKMPGHMGVARRTVQNLKVVQVRNEEGLLLISGCVAGSNGGYVVVRPAIKAVAPKA
jgi:large subunit ribosomal protein L3